MSSRKPFFSVIIPVHNNMHLLDRSVGSVLEQSFDDFELLLVNDASTDGSKDYIRTFKDPRIRVFDRDQPSPGGYAARNLGIEEARAGWIAFLDSDDEWMPEHLENMSALIAQGEHDIVSEGWINSYPDRPRSVCPYASKNDAPHGRSLDLFGYLSYASKGKSPFCTNVITVKRALLLDVGGFPAGKSLRGGDTATWMRIMRRSGRALCATTVGAIYHREDSTVTTTGAPPIEENSIRSAVLEAMIDEADPKIIRELQRFANRHIRSALLHQLSRGKLSWSNCYYHFGRVNRLEHLAFRAFSVMPGFIQRYHWVAARRLKRMVFP